MITLLIMDGFGLSTTEKGNAIAAANTPNIDSYKKYPYTTLGASGLDVGLPDGTMGNSEVGHMNMGAGRIVYQDLTRISKSITDGDFFENPAFLGAIENCKKHNSALHLFGLITDAGVHAHNSHLFALLKLAKLQKLDNVYIHAILDGRDTPPKSAAKYLELIDEQCLKIGVGKIATILGRYWIMDRDNNNDRVAQGFTALVGEDIILPQPAQSPLVGADTIRPQTAQSSPTRRDDLWSSANGTISPSWQTALATSYSNNITDEFAKPTIIGGERIQPNDSIIFFNFRKDRAKQITRMFQETFQNLRSKKGIFDWRTRFSLGKKRRLSMLSHSIEERRRIAETSSSSEYSSFLNAGSRTYFVCFTEYDHTIPNTHIAFPMLSLQNHLGEYLSKMGKTNFRVAETEKYNHVTYYFNALVDKEYPGEKRVLIPSEKVATFDLSPNMRATDIAQTTCELIESREYDFGVVNLANPDMLGHTGNFEAAVQGIETVDTAVGKIVETSLKHGDIVILTADHGNAEIMEFPDGSKCTSHTTSPVPLWLIEEENSHPIQRKLHHGTLGDIAPTILDLMNIEKPAEMTGNSLIN